MKGFKQRRLWLGFGLIPVLVGCGAAVRGFMPAGVDKLYTSMWTVSRPAGNAAEPGQWSGQGWAYVASEVSTGLTIVDLATNKPVAFIQGAGTTHHPYITRDQRWVFATQRYGRQLMAVDTDNDNKVKFLEFKDAGVENPGPLHMGFSPDGKWALVALNQAGAVGVIDAATAEVVRVVKDVGSYPRDIAITPDSRKAFVSLQRSPWVAVIDLETWIVRKIKRSDSSVYEKGSESGLGMTADGKYVMVANTPENSVTVIDTQAEKVVKTIPNIPGPVNPGPLGNSPYFAVTNRADGSVSFFDTRDWSLIKTLKTGQGANVAYWGPDGNVWVTHNGTQYVAVVDPGTWTVTKEIPVVLRPHWLNFTPDGSKAYATNWGARELSVIDVKKQEQVEVVKVGSNPNGIALKTNVSKERATAWLKNAEKAQETIEKASTLAMPPARNADEQVFFNTCMQCHDVGRIVRNNARGEQWKAIVNRMKGHGARMTPEDEAKILKYLMSGQQGTLKIQTVLQKELGGGSAGQN